MTDPELLRKISEYAEWLRWAPTLDAMIQMDRSALYEVVIDDLVTWLYKAEHHEYAKYYTAFRCKLLGDKLADAARARMADPIMELQRSYTTESAYRELVQKACQLIIDTMDAIAWNEAMH